MVKLNSGGKLMGAHRVPENHRLGKSRLPEHLYKKLVVRPWKINSNKKLSEMNEVSQQTPESYEVVRERALQRVLNDFSAEIEHYDSHARRPLGKSVHQLRTPDYRRAAAKANMAGVALLLGRDQHEPESDEYRAVDQLMEGKINEHRRNAEIARALAQEHTTSVPEKMPALR
jgi:hypothetical protein